MQGKEQLNTWTLREYLRNALMIGLKIPAWCCQLLLFWLPLHPERILIYSLKQRGYSCNLKYLTEHLKRDPGQRFEILWVVRTREEQALVSRHGVKAVLLHSPEHIFYRLRAGIVITNDEFYPLFLKRRGQRYINVWHGAINYKKIGYEGLSFTNPMQRLIYRMNNPRPDCFVSGSRAFTQTTAQAFRFPREIFLECGLPRNDLLCRTPDPARLSALRQRLGIPEGARAVLYAPTFRKGKNGAPALPDEKAICDALSRRFGGRWVMLVRQHYFVDGGEKSPGDIIDVSHYEDMQELLLCSQCLISDYSSCMWDYSLTRGPCFAYTPDLEEYRERDRSFFIPPENWPYPVCADVETLCRNIMEFDEQQYRARVAEHHMTQGRFDRGTACEALEKKLIQYLEEKQT